MGHSSRFSLVGDGIGNFQTNAWVKLCGLWTPSSPGPPPGATVDESELLTSFYCALDGSS